MSIPTLPLELFAIIIDDLDMRTLIRCREVCKILCNLIDNSSSFQYKIELAVAGMDDGPPSDLRPIERLRILNAHQTAWTQLSWKEFRVHIPRRLSLWTCSGSVLAMGHHKHHPHNFAEFLVTLVQLPSVLRGIEEKTWRIVIKTNRRVRKFEIDPSQDLIILVSEAQDDDRHVYRHVHLNMLSTGEPHPLSAGELTHREAVFSFFERSYRIQIIDNMVGVQCVQTHHLTIWDWRTGELRMDTREGFFSFLTKDLVIVGVAVGPVLNIYDLRRSSNEGCTPAKIPLLCALEFLHHSTSTSFPINIYTDLSSGRTSRYTPSAPFRVSQNDRLYAFGFPSIDDPLMLMVFVPLSVFLAHIDGLRAGETGRSFSWEEWGEKDAQVLEFVGPFLDIRCIHGMKFSLVNNNQIEVYDFNRLSIRRGLLSGTVHPPDSFVTDNPFTQPVYSSLPYQVRSASMPAINGTVIITEDCLIPLPNWNFPRVPPRSCAIFSF